ncbi:manganese efflux pump MntP family protein [Microbacter margulisiae]|uniref:Putative manganese efflux pump MntP n=1 Tax=Microbacter margulisiae TaxID=1350067 RepID=A0A7W5H3H4_9PORP|nr:manganese efflux pump MntP family protein [Microbacter margulisiae]MBB3188387.1 putative Mn2+ efflux pump MntP [Microbacter margulisiae]
MDTVSVSVAAGCSKQPLKIGTILRFALVLAVMQGGMPVLGWFLGEHVADLLSHIDHWIAFGLLTWIGGKMVYDGIIEYHHPHKKKSLRLNSYKFLFTLGIATSIDAFAVGFTFAALHQTIWLPVFIITLTTLAFALLGIFVGRKIGNHFQNYAEIVGGLLLIGIGIKIVIEHLSIH